VIAWPSLLQLLEGCLVHLPAPKNTYTKDICINHDVPIFATCKETIKYVGKFNQMDPRENEMMDVRWKVFKFFFVFEEKDQKDIPPCAKCFAKMVFTEEL